MNDKAPTSVSEEVYSLPVILTRPAELAPLLWIKRGMDLTLAAVCLAIFSPVFAVVAAIIRLDSEGPVFYRAIRVGQNGRRFVFYKFRTMVDNAHALKPHLQHLNEREGPFFKIAADPRMTRVGRWLRRFSIDELPQLWNVLVGDMSMVGPRPPDADEIHHYRPQDFHGLDVLPGVTGLWQVSQRLNPSFDTKMALDREYIEKWSLWLDCKILLKTIPVVLKADGQ